jgi:hypothetical protein
MLLCINFRCIKLYVVLLLLLLSTSGWTKFLEDKYSSMKPAERDALVERMSIIQENPWVKDEM